MLNFQVPMLRLLSLFVLFSFFYLVLATSLVETISLDLGILRVPTIWVVQVDQLDLMISTVAETKKQPNSRMLTV